MANSRIITGTLVDGAAVTASSQTASLPASNLQNDIRGKVWRPTGCADEYADFVFDDPHPFNCLAVLNHNLTAYGEITVQAGTGVGDSSLMNETFDAQEILFGFGEGGFGEHGFGGYLTTNEIATYFPAGALRVIYFDQVWSKYWRIKFADPNNPAGYIEVGRLLLDAYRQSEQGVALGMPNTPDDPSLVSYSEGGQTWKTSKKRYRTASYTYPYVSANQSYGLWYSLLQELGVGSHFVGDFLYGTGNLSMRMHNQLYCHIPAGGLSGITLLEKGQSNFSLSVRESL